MITTRPTSISAAPARRNWTVAEKAQAVRRHLRDGVSVADLAEELGTAPTQVYGWIKLVLERAEIALIDKREKLDHCADKALAAKEQRIRHLEEVTAELSMEVLQLEELRGTTTSEHPLARMDLVPTILQSGEAKAGNAEERPAKE